MKVFYNKFCRVLFYFESLLVVLFDSVWIYVLYACKSMIYLFLTFRSYSNGRPEHAAFSWRTCSWDTGGKLVLIPAHSAHTEAWKHRHLHFYALSSIVFLFTAHKQTLSFFLFVCFGHDLYVLYIVPWVEQKWCK